MPDLNALTFEIILAFIARFRAEDVDLEPLRVSLHERIDALEENEADLGPSLSYVLRSSRQLLPVIDLIEVGEFEAAAEALDFIRI